jgi:quinoprotein glucose dehydrogenase
MHRILWAIILLSAAVATSDSTRTGAGDWPVYGADSGGSKYSPLKTIDRTNVATLAIAWTFSTGEPLEHLPHSGKPPSFEATPIVIDGVMYIGTPYGHVFALDAATGAKKWTYDAHIDVDGNYGDFANRGVSSWLDPAAKADAPCGRRIFFGSIDARLTALDAATGQPCVEFGQRGEIDLIVGLRRGPGFKGEYEETSPPAIINDLVIVGSGIADNVRAQAPTGEVRAFDVRTGRLRWTWHPIDSAQTGQANAWSAISTDPARNLVFVPTGSASPDYFGGLRPGDNRDANSVVALNAKDGRRVWGFQTVHHDLWDYDVASQPTLFTARRDGRDIPAVAVGSKTGHLFLLDRLTGRPLFGVEERAVPASDVPGEHASPTQPIPTRPKPWVRQRLTVDEAWGITDADRDSCRQQMADLRSEGIFTPPSLKGSLMMPSNIGGMNWGGVAWDRDHGLLIVPTNNLAVVIRLIPRDNVTQARQSNRIGTEIANQNGTPFGMSRAFLRAPSGVPCTPPPWGELAAVDVSTGTLKWHVPFGAFPGVPEPQASQWGSINLGGPMVTAGGLIFIGASLDASLKAFDVETGKELWRGTLPTSARATPMTYEVNHTQYVAIAAGGHEGVTKLDNPIVVFHLP